MRSMINGNPGERTERTDSVVHSPLLHHTYIFHTWLVSRTITLCHKVLLLTWLLQRCIVCMFLVIYLTYLLIACLSFCSPARTLDLRFSFSFSWFPQLLSIYGIAVAAQSIHSGRFTALDTYKSLPCYHGHWITWPLYICCSHFRLWAEVQARVRPFSFYCYSTSIAYRWLH